MECDLPDDSVICSSAFQQLQMDDDKFEVCPSALDWKELVVMEQFLEPFYKGKPSLFF